MNCREISKQLAAYLDEEVSPSEKKLMQAHLTTCKNCQRELELLGWVKKDVSLYLRTRATAAAPSSQAWTTLKDSLPTSPPGQSTLEKAVRSISFPRRLSLEGFSAQRMAIILVFLIALVAVAPPVWARIEPIITHWFSFSSPDGESSAAIGGFKAFTPYYATYIPEGFQQSLLGSTTFMEPEVESLEIGYDSEERFIVLIQSKGAGVTGLPTGESAWINANPAIFIPSYATSQTDLREKQPTLSIDTNYDYENTNLLAWFAGEIKIEILSNLPLEEMMRVAESLESMQDSEGEAPGIQ